MHVKLFLIFSQVLQALRASAAGAKCHHEFYHVSDDTLVRECATE